MTTTFETAKVGDRVWAAKRGWGKIIDIRHSNYPLNVNFDNGDFDTYTIDGYVGSNRAMQDLFWDVVKIEAPKKPLPDLEIDTKVWVWRYSAEKHKRHFAGFRGNQICTFDAGRTSFTREYKGAITSWPNWELAE